MAEVDQVLRGGTTVIHQHHEIGAAGDDHPPFPKLGLVFERFLERLRLAEHSGIIPELFPVNHS